MGTAVMGGTAAASLIAIFLIPVTFYVVGRVADRRKRKSRMEQNERSAKGAEITGGTEGEE
jgi:HAE1 family hydrophobic/amphiphilic exporter-1